MGNNMFAYCNNNPVIFSDSTGNLPIRSTEFGAAAMLRDGTATRGGIIPDKVREAEELEKQGKNLFNTSEEAVFASDGYAFYKGVLVVKTPFDASFSFGVIGLSTHQQDSNTLKHEYGHTVQLENRGVVDYTLNVAIPSVTINILERQGRLPYDYYSYPWEAEANKLGGAILFQNGKSSLPPGGYTSYWELIQLFFE